MVELKWDKKGSMPEGQKVGKKKKKKVKSSAILSPRINEAVKRRLKLFDGPATSHFASWSLLFGLFIVYVFNLI